MAAMKPGALALAAVLGAIMLAQPAPAAVPFAQLAVSVPSTTGGIPQDIPAALFKPDGNGLFPAIVILHDCSGLGPRSSGSPGRWAQRLAAEGYVVILPDSFTPRGYPQGVCTVSPTARTDTVNPLPRAYDAYATLAFLRSLPYVDGAHVGVMGGSHGGSTTLVVDTMPVSPAAPLAAAREHGFAAAIALYPGCGSHLGTWNVQRSGGLIGPVTQYLGTYQPVAPLMILVGGQDDWTPAEHCRVLAERAQAAGYPVTIKIYPGANHSFDSNAPVRYLDNRRNANKPEGHGATTGGDPAAWADSIEQVKAFFARYLRP
ncbi:MAG TPA: dienelactone hydrolase family protein [Stellaceae bacterium]|jgi:dienelactone hydrolase